MIELQSNLCINPLSFHLIQLGEEDGEPIILLHGAGKSLKLTPHLFDDDDEEMTLGERGLELYQGLIEALNARQPYVLPEGVTVAAVDQELETTSEMVETEFEEDDEYLEGVDEADEDDDSPGAKRSKASDDSADGPKDGGRNFPRR